MGQSTDMEAIAAELARAGFVAAEDEACELMRAASNASELSGFVARRIEGEPLAWITGTTLFCGRELHVEPGVFVPRAQSEELARRAARCLSRSIERRALDLCTGSGAIAAHLIEATGGWVVGVDCDERAVRCASGNGVPAVLGDLGSAFTARSFDVITAVSPYVPSDALVFLPRDVQRYEARALLDGGADGLDVVRAIVEQSAQLLRPGGTLYLELGAEQDQQIISALDQHGFEKLDRWCDEDGDLRGMAANSVR